MSNIITPEFRGAYVFVTVPQLKDKDDPSKGKAYSIQAFFPPEADLTQMKAEAEGAIIKKFGADKANWPKTFRSPFRKNEELDKPQAGIPDDWTVMRFAMNELDSRGIPQKPGVVDARLQDVIDPTKLFAGAWYRADVNAFWYETKGNKGVSFGLNHVMLSDKPGDPLGGARTPANKAFEAVAGAAASKTATSLFD